MQRARTTLKTLLVEFREMSQALEIFKIQLPKTAAVWLYDMNCNFSDVRVSNMVDQDYVQSLGYMFSVRFCV